MNKSKHTPRKQITSHQGTQQGAALIYVLIVLLLVTIIGTAAVRSGLFSLRVATNTQIEALLNQSTNAALSRVQTPTFLGGYLTRSGLFGYIRQPANHDKEMVFCFKQSQAQFFDIDQASIIYKPEGGTAIKNNELGTAGYCDPRDSDGGFFSSARRVVMTQVTIKQQNFDPDSIPLADVAMGTDISNLKVDESSNFKVYAVSLFPNLSDATDAQIYQCLSARMSDPPVDAVQQQTITACLTDLNVPYNTQAATYKYHAGFTR